MENLLDIQKTKEEIDYDIAKVNSGVRSGI
jgi:hypothetical protein